MKERTSVALDPHVRRGLVREAKQKGISVSKLVNELAMAHLSEEKRAKPRDSIFVRVPMPKTARRVKDAVINHDYYAYDLEDS